MYYIYGVSCGVLLFLYIHTHLLNILYIFPHILNISYMYITYMLCMWASVCVCEGTALVSETHSTGLLISPVVVRLSVT